MTTRKPTPPPNRSISLSEVTLQSSNEIIRFIYDINNEDKNLDPDQRSPIKIIILNQ